jgi:ribose/xylose/arabinose/galactoside ABC-type transport system permease subunit
MREATRIRTLPGTILPERYGGMRPITKLPRELPTLILLACVCIVMALTVPAFHTTSNLTVVGENAAFIGIMACGEGVVILAGGLDLSVGSILALCSCATAAALAAGWAWPLAALLGLALGALSGVINGLLITYRQIPPILTTLATLLLFRHGVSIATQARNYGPFSDAFNRIGAGWTPALLLLLVAALFMLLTLRGRFGRWILAVGGNEQAARLSAVPVDAVKRRAYLLSGLCAGLAGLITMAFNNNAQSSVGQGYELDVIAACVVGGVRITGGDGTVLGAALGAFLIALMRNIFDLTQRPSEQHGLILGIVILAAAGLEQWRKAREGRRSFTQ